MKRIYFALINICIVLSIVGCPFEESYWERYKSVYDPKLKQMRCVDETGNIMDMEPPCYVLTLAGRQAVTKKEKDCIEAGGQPEKCKNEAWNWLYSKRPK